jgi:hypothetical protein
MRSLPTIDYHSLARHNREKLMSVLTELAPHLYRIQMALDSFHVNPELIPPIIRTIGNLNVGSGFGEVTILMKSRTITQIKGAESNIVGLAVDNEQNEVVE